MNQHQEIIDYIRKFGSMTPMDAFPLGITKLATRVSEMRKQGIEFDIQIEKGINKNGKTTRYARYRLKENENV